MKEDENHADNRLNTAANIARGDDVYEALVDAHSGLPDEDSAKLNTKLILLLANHIGDADIIFEAIKKAGKDAV